MTGSAVHLTGRERGAGELRLPVIEHFGPTVQGEGLVIGLKSLFLRLAGCDWSCRWCDSKFTWHKDELAPILRLTPTEIRARLLSLPGGCRNLTITGGNPALHDLTQLIALLKEADGFRIHVETQGSAAPAWFADVDLVTFSPKPPSSGMAPDWRGLEQGIRLSRERVLKIVVFDEGDYEYAKAVRRRFPDVPFVLQAGNAVGTDDRDAWLAKLERLVNKVIQDPALDDVRVLPQLHVILWGNRRGV